MEPLYVCMCPTVGPQGGKDEAQWSPKAPEPWLLVGFRGCLGFRVMGIYGGSGYD